MEFKTVEDAKRYLSQLDSVIVPKEYTYFVHWAGFDLPLVASQKKFNKAWTELPINQFIVKREMSFVTKKDRVLEALHYGGLKYASSSYAKAQTSKPFQIRVIMPNWRLSPDDIKRLNMSLEDINLLNREYSGLGDHRHPKLQGKEIIEIFATSTVDEVSKTETDIFYGIRRQDLLTYAKIVSEIFALNPIIPRENIPQTIDEFYKWGNNDFSLPKNKNNHRYSRKYIKDATGKIQLFQYSDFEQEYLDNLKQQQEINYQR